MKFTMGLDRAEHLGSMFPGDVVVLGQWEKPLEMTKYTVVKQYSPAEQCERFADSNTGDYPTSDELSNHLLLNGYIRPYHIH